MHFILVCWLTADWKLEGRSESEKSSRFAPSSSSSAPLSSFRRLQETHISARSVGYTLSFELRFAFASAARRLGNNLAAEEVETLSAEE